MNVLVAMQKAAKQISRNKESAGKQEIQYLLPITFIKYDYQIIVAL